MRRSCNDQALGSDRLDAEIVGARGDGALDLGAQKILEYLEERVLQVDGQREQPIEEGGDRRQVLAQAAVAVGEPQAGRVLEAPAASSPRPCRCRAGDRAGAAPPAHRRLSRLSSARNRPWPPVWRWPRVMAPSVSSRRAMVERKRFSALTSVAIGRNSGGCAWLVRLERPSPWMAVSAFQPASSR